MKSILKWTLLLLLVLNVSFSFGRVIYRPTNIPQPSSSTGVDINNDGINDFRFKQTFLNGFPAPSIFTCPSEPLIYQQSHFVFHYSLENISGTSFTDFGFLAPGLIINSLTHSYYSLSDLGRIEVTQFTPSNCSGNQQISTNIPPLYQNGYIGFKFIINGLIHYGWVQMSGNSIIGIAYESIPGYPIVTGDKIGYYSDTFLATANVIKGKIYSDINSNCLFDIGEMGLESVVVYTTNGDYAGVTDSEGNYEIYVPGGSTTYQLDIDVSKENGYTIIKVCPTGTLSASFTGNNQIVTSKNFSVSSCSDLKVNITSDRRRRCFRNNTIVSYSNLGSVTSASATVKVIMPNYVKALSSIPAWNSKVGDTLFYSIGTVGPFGNGQIKIIDSVVCGDPSIMGLSVCTKAIISPKTFCNVPVGWDQADLLVTGFCTDSLFYATITNSGNSMQGPSFYRIFLDGVMIKRELVQLSSYQNKRFEIPCHGKALRIEVDQTPSHPQLSLRSLSFEGCGNFMNNSISYGVITKMPTNQGGFAEATSCIVIRDSYDPNDKQANPVGSGAENSILADGDQEYIIRFQNTGNDEAYTVVVVDTLSSNLDLGSLEVIGASHPYKLEVTGKNNPRLVWIFGGINLPDSTTNEPASHGYITFKVAQKPGLSVGTIIKNKAYIYFDYNVAVITNEVSQKIYAAYPQNLMTVNTQPTIKNLCVNNALTLDAAASGYGSLDYLWYKDNVALIGATTTSFVVNSVSSLDMGNYKCRIASEMDTIFTNSVLVTVNPIPDLTTTNPAPVCNTPVDITNSYLDNNTTTGVVSYWTDANATTSLTTPTAVPISGTYFIKKLVGGVCSDIKSIDVEINTCNSTIEELNKLYNVTVSPNPTIDKISIESNVSSLVSIFDNQGKELIQKQVVSGKNEMDLSSFASGSYIVSFTINNKKYTVPIIKQ